MPTENAQTSPAQNQGDAKSGNLTVAEATQRLMASYLPKEAEQTQQKSEVTEVAPVEVTETVTEGSTAETAPDTEQTEAQAEVHSEEGDDVLSHNTDLTPEEREKFKSVTQQWQEGVNKRIGKEKGRREAAEARIRELEESLQKVSTEKPEPDEVAAPTPDNPLSDVVDVQSLVSREREANQVIDQAQAYLDQLDNSGAAEIKVGDTTYNRQTLREIRRGAERALREHIPQRHRFLAQQAEFRKLVQRDVPEILDPKSPMFKEAQQARVLYPQLATLPNGDYLIGLALKGARSLAAEQAAKKKPAVTSSKVPVSQTAVTAAVSTQSRNKVNGSESYEAEKKKVFAKGNVSGQEAAALLLKREQLSTSR